MGEKIKKSFIILLSIFVILLVSSASVQALLKLENADVNITIETLPDGRCYIMATAEMPGLAIPKKLVGMKASVHFEASSPSVGLLLGTVDGSVTLPEAALDKLSPAMLSAATPEMINLMLANFEGKSLSELMGMVGQRVEIPPEIADVKIESLTCTKFSWKEPTLSAGFSATLSGTIFENQKLRDELPITIDGTLDVSKTTMSVGADFNTKTADGGFGMIATAEKISLWFEGSFELPRVGNEVWWEFFPETQTIWGAEQVEDLKALLKKNNIKLTLEAPPEAEVSGLPPGYTQDGSTYAWSGTEAADALATQVTGTVSPDITYTYVYVPPPTIVSSPPPEVVEEQKLTISGIAQPNSTVKIYSNGVFKTTTTAGSDGSFSADVMLDEGFNSIRVSTTDLAGNESSRSLYGATVYTPAAPAAAPIPWRLIGAGITIIVAAVVGVAIALRRRRARK